MMTGELKSKIDSLWEIFWTGGLTNPLDVIEQMTYLMFTISTRPTTPAPRRAPCSACRMKACSPKR